MTGRAGMAGPAGFAGPAGSRRGEAAPFPWDAAIGIGLGVLRLSPDAFWRMTPRELALALRARGLGIAAPLGRAALDDLIRRYPDG